MIKEIEGIDAFKEEIKEGKVLVDVYSKVCGPCKMLGFVLNDVNKELPDVKILKVDYDRNKEMITEYDVPSYPTLIMFDNGVETQRLKGLQQKPMIKKMIEA